MGGTSYVLEICKICRWIESVIKSKVRKRKTNIYQCICVESTKMVQNRRTYLQGRNRDADIEKGHVDMRGKGTVGQNGE